jgi:LemA protein
MAGTVVILVVVALVVLLGLLAIALFNRLVALRQRVREAWSDIDVQLKRRHDLVPNLVETVKGYAAHERGVFDEVTRARAAAVAAGGTGPEERARAEGALTGALRSLFAVAEAYPQLRAVEQFNTLSENLTSTEDRIQFARRFYNGQVRDYDIAVQSFPSALVAGAFGFRAEEYFELEQPSDRAVPVVSFGP